jgi:hypothetical protein
VSRSVGIDTVRLRPAARLAHTEYCDHAVLMREVERLSGKAFEDAWELDLVWHTDDGPVAWPERGRTTDMGHAEYAEGGADRREARPSPFTDPEEVLEFDAVGEYGLPDLGGLVAYYEGVYRREQESRPNQVFPGGYYRTLVSGAIEAFGWEMLLAAAADRERFERVLDSFFRLSMRHYAAWAKTSVEVFISHDDMVWSAGPFMDPAFYRRAVFPRYRELWAGLKAAGKKVLYCSDGDWSMFLDDVAAAGADGLIFEPVVPLDEVVARFGRTHVIVGSKVDARTLTFGTKEEIASEVDATIELARDCPGFVFAVGNHIPANVPVENALFYFEHLRGHWAR